MAGEFSTLRRYTAMHTTTDGQQGERGDPMKALARIAALALVFLWTPSPPRATAQHRPPHRIPLELFAVLHAAFPGGVPARVARAQLCGRHALHHREPLCGGGTPRAFPSLAAELVGRQVAVIVTSGAQAIQAVKQATSTIPVLDLLEALYACRGP